MIRSMMRFTFSLPVIMFLSGVVVVLAGCRQNDPGPALFESLPPSITGIDFINRLDEKPGNNILESEFFYNGGGVAVGDINNNGLPDIYFTANQGENALYENLGDYQFRNITREAGVSDSTGWSAGTAMADITGNGLPDIYVCKAGKEEVDERRNKLYINNGDFTFTERAAEFGLDDPGYCTQAVFFDYNGNGLLDVFIVNYNVRVFTNFDILTIRDEHDPYAGDKLYRNNGDGTFTDVSEEAGILQNPLGFGLSATVSDLNGNGLPDIYVANDFMERDYMYINQGDGTFTEEVQIRTDVTSYFSMGSDIADINNDGLPDIFVVDMLPPDYTRRRVFKTPDYSIADQLAAHGYHRKIMRNVLQMNNGDGTFTEVGQLAGVSMSDWSWASLIADFNNNGHKDIYITNGFPRFYTNLDYLNDILWKQYPDENLPEDPGIRYNLVLQMQEVEMHNYAFKNMGGLSFKDATETWGLKEYSVSGGAAYADLNNNGTLDLIVSNLNKPPFIYKNNSRQLNDNNYLKVRLTGSGANTFGIGSKVKVTGKNGGIYFQEAYHTRGFQSTVDPVMLFGLGSENLVDIEIIWPDQSKQILRDVPANQMITVNQDDADNLPEEVPNPADDTRMFLLLDEVASGLDFSHQGSVLSDRIFNPLMPHTLSNLGPAIASEDVNNDGLADIYIGGGQDQPAVLYLQQETGTFLKANVPIFDEHREYQDVDAVFLDANGNGHPDLYVVSGGNFDRMNGQLYQDRLYLNDGFGNFTYSPGSLPRMHTSGGSVTVLDIDGNGVPDLFVGGRVVTGQYPAPPRSYLLKNNNGSFADVTRDVAPDLLNPGMVTDAVWADVDNDGENELIITGEWMPIRIFKKNSNRTFREITEAAGLESTSGWWNVIKAADLTGNGHTDLIAGNRGLNSDFNASPENPVILYHGDFNNNGLYDPVMTKVVNEKRFPIYDRDLLLQQLPHLKDRFPDYASYSTATIFDILTRQQIRNASELLVHTFASTAFVNNGNGTFEAKPLPAEAQIAPVFDIMVDHFHGNDTPDILIAGNNFGTRSEFGPMASHGILLKGSGDLDFIPYKSKDTGFYGVGEVRKIELVPTQIGPLILTGRYNDSLVPYLYRFRNQTADNM